MTEYHIKAAGNNTLDGLTPATAWRDLWFAVLKSAAGDTFNIDAPATSPLRDMIYQTTNGALGTPITYQGYGDYAYLLASRDISHDAEDIEHVFNSLCDSFVDASTMAGWTFSAASFALNVDPAYYQTGNGSLKIWKAGGTNISGDGPHVPLRTGDVYEINIRHIETAVGADYKPRIYLRYDIATDQYLYAANVENCADNGAGLIRVTITGHAFVDGTSIYIENVTGTTEANGAWTIAVIDVDNFDLIGSTFANAYISGGVCSGWSTTKNLILNIVNGTSWQETSIRFVVPASTVYKLHCNCTITGSYICYVDEISIKRKNPFSWSLYGGTTYKLDQSLHAIYGFSKCSKTAWSLNGCDALEFSTPGHLLSVATDKDTLAAGHWVQDGVSVYYRLASGETDITDIHFEADRLQGRYGNLSGGVQMLADYIVTKRIKSYHASFTAGNANVGNECENCEAWFQLKYQGFNVKKTSLLRCNSYYCMEGFEINIAGGGTCLRCYSYKAGDDGFQIVVGADGEFHCCIAVESGWELGADNCGFGVEGVGADGKIYNCTSYKSYGRGISVSGDGNVEVVNCISTETVLAEDFYATAEWTGALTHTNNLGGSYDARWSQGATEYIDDPEFIDAVNGDFRLLPTSPCRDAGVVIAGLTTDFEGKPIITGHIPIGAYAFPVPSPMGLTPGLGLGGRMIPPRRRRR